MGRLGHHGSPCCSVLPSSRRRLHIPSATARPGTPAHQTRRSGRVRSSEKELCLDVFRRPGRHPCCFADAAVERAAAEQGRGAGNPLRGSFLATRGAAGWCGRQHFNDPGDHGSCAGKGDARGTTAAGIIRSTNSFVISSARRGHRAGQILLRRGLHHSVLGSSSIRRGSSSPTIM